ncbi:hypothetical protein Tco_0835477 [Tanacetum coccineum]
MREMHSTNTLSMCGDGLYSYKGWARPGIKERVNNVLHDIVPKIALNVTDDLINDNLPRVVADVVKKERETSKAIVPGTSTATTTADLQHQLYLLMKLDLQAQVADPKLWDILKRKFEKSSVLGSSCRDDAFRKRDHDEHQGDDGPPKGEKSAKRQKTFKGSKSARGSSSKQQVQGSKTSASERQ